MVVGDAEHVEATLPEGVEHCWRRSERELLGQRRAVFDQRSLEVADREIGVAEECSERADEAVRVFFQAGRKRPLHVDVPGEGDRDRTALDRCFDGIGDRDSLATPVGRVGGVDRRVVIVAVVERERDAGTEQESGQQSTEHDQEQGARSASASSQVCSGHVVQR